MLCTHCSVKKNKTHHVRYILIIIGFDSCRKNVQSRRGRKREKKEWLKNIKCLNFD
jgi:hypothetical protein